jgi:DNA-binding NtrC family response regulator
VSAETTPLPLVGQGSAMRALAARLEELQRDVSCPVLLVGARGLGKRYLAQRIHRGSALADSPLLVLDARRGGSEALVGVLETAPRGASLLVRHVEQLSLAAQVLLDERTGTQGGIARLMATTTADIVSRVTSKEFIEALYYRLYAWPMLLPALADRTRDDLVALAEAVLEQTADADADLPVTLSVGARDLLMRHPWRENLRELEATLALAQLRARGSATIGAADLTMQADDAAPPSTATLADVERWHMLRAVATFKGNRTHAARSLGVSRMTLISKLKLFSDEDAIQ